ncbi:hypothetical protein DFH08DRAFT_873671 [Mycena albidolilacea]|uniref:Uncharacterized protein n=1 Tax=Mycena albidolilacea TaxID=1033008 RepID=A0AAD7EP77_9AGAR|nr:hypothetical protein DFH08DRAFT_873671 [Mycena albidolilacea]
MCAGAGAGACGGGFRGGASTGAADMYVRVRMGGRCADTRAGACGGGCEGTERTWRRRICACGCVRRQVRARAHAEEGAGAEQADVHGVRWVHAYGARHARTQQAWERRVRTRARWTWSPRGGCGRADTAAGGCAAGVRACRMSEHPVRCGCGRRECVAGALGCGGGHGEGRCMRGGVARVRRGVRAEPRVRTCGRCERI